MGLCCNPKPFTEGNRGVSFYVPTPPGTMISGTNSAAMTVRCHCGQPSCADYKAPA